MNILQFAVAAAACGFLAAGAFAQWLPAQFDLARDAAGDVATVVAMARAQRKRVLVDVGGEWCSWCHVLDRFVAFLRAWAPARGA